MGNEYTRLDAETISAMTGEEAQAALDRMATEFFGKTSWRGDLARYIDAQARTIRLWMEPDKRPPTYALLLLSAEIEAKKHRQTVEMLAAVVKAVS